MVFWGLFHMHPQIEAFVAWPVLGPAFQREPRRQWFWRHESWEGASSTQRGDRHSPVGGDAGGSTRSWGMTLRLHVQGQMVQRGLSLASRACLFSLLVWGPF